jgi:hypothetical protein
MSQLNSLLESANTYKSLQSDSARLANKWSKTGLLEGMASETDKNNMSMILENQAKQLVTENTQTGGGAATFTAGTGAAGQWAGVALPLVRKVFGQIAAKEFVSVQPMNLPSGLVFYLDFQYGGTQVASPANAANAAKTPFATGTSMYGTPSPVNPATNTSGFGNAATGGLYGAGRFGYSTQNFTAAAVTANICTIGNADFYFDLEADSTYPFVLTGVAAQNLNGVQISQASTVTKVNALATTSANAVTTMLQTNYDTKALTGFYLIGTNGVAFGSLPAFTKIELGAIFVAPTNAGGNGTAGTYAAARTVSVIPAGATAVANGIFFAANGGALGTDDFNVSPTTSTSVNGRGFTMNVLGFGAAVPTAIVNNPGSGYAAGDVLTFSALAYPLNGATSGLCTFNVAAAVLPAAGVISWFGLGTITAGVTAGWVQDAAAGAVNGNDTVGGIICQQTLQPTDNNRGDFEDGNAALGAALYNTPIAIPEINVAMSSEAIVAKTKKLKAVWTPEFAQDLNAYHSLDAEAELTSIMSEYISLEIDQEILAMLIESAGAGDEYWSAVNNTAIGVDGVINAPNAGGAGVGTGLGFFNSQGQWFQTLGTKVQKLSNIIHQRTLRGGANFMVCSPTVATIIESIPGFASNSDGDAAKMSYAFGVQKAGSMNGRYQVYKNPYMTDNTMLLGYRGGQFLEAGAVFAPYIPLIMTPLVYDPTTFTPRKGLLTRYAKKMLRPEFYGRIYVSGLNTL